MIDRKRIREIVGYTRERLTADPNAWYRLASSFHSAAQLLDEFSERIPADSRPFVLNAALSLELIFKAIVAKKCESISEGRDGHNLSYLCKAAGVELSNNQMITLELLAETIVWAGRYPGPKTTNRWNEYHDGILEKHIVRNVTGNVSQTIANRETFPDWGNYQKIWDACVAVFEYDSQT